MTTVVLDDSLAADAEGQGIERFVVGAVIHRAGTALVITRSAEDAYLPGIEELPSGGVEPRETLLDALDRELLEEVGFPADRIDPGFLASFDYVSGSSCLTRQFTVSVALQERRVRLSDEHSSLRWISRSELDSTTVSSETRSVLAHWFEWAERALATEKGS